MRTLSLHLVLTIRYCRLSTEYGKLKPPWLGFTLREFLAAREFYACQAQGSKYTHIACCFARVDICLSDSLRAVNAAMIYDFLKDKGTTKLDG